jgi:hypothetical protein
VASEEAKGVAAEAKDQARSLVGEARGQLQTQLEDQGRQQKDRLAGTLATFGDDLGSMAENGSGLAADVAHEVADRARSLSRHLEGREPGELLDDVRRFARRRPGTFLLGALAAGIVVGRLARGTKDAIDAADAEQETARASTSGSLGTTVGEPPYQPAVPTPPPPVPDDYPPATGTGLGAPTGEHLAGGQGT